MTVRYNYLGTRVSILWNRCLWWHHPQQDTALCWNWGGGGVLLNVWVKGLHKTSKCAGPYAACPFVFCSLYWYAEHILTIRYGLFLWWFNLRPLSTRTEHSWLVVHHCCNSSVLSLLSALPALFPVCTCFFFLYFSAVLFKLIVIFPPMTSIKRDRKEEKTNTVDITFCLDVFWTAAWAFFNTIESDLIGFYIQLSV